MSRDRSTRAALIAGLAVVAGLAGGLSLTWRAELVSADLRQRLSPVEFASHGRLVIIAVDDESAAAGAAELRRLPWPRAAYARMLQVIALSRPAAVAIDLHFPEPADGDEELAEALAGVPVVLACDAGPGGEAGATTVPGVPPTRSPRWGVKLSPVRSLASRATFAMTHVEADADGVTRRFPLVANNAGTVMAALPLALARRAGAAVESRGDGVWAQGRRLTGADGELWPRFPGGAGSFRYIPAWRVLAAWQSIAEGEPPAHAAPFLAQLTGAVVVITVTATGGFDLRSVPTAAIYPGGELLATAVASVLDGRCVLPPGRAMQAAAAVGLTLLVGLLALRLRRPVVLALSGLTVLVSWGVLAWLAWARADVWLPIAAPALGVVLALPVLLVEGWWREGAERRRLHAIFGHYVAPEILRVLLEHPDAARLGGDRRRITVLFSDIRGYTTLSENLSPEAVVGWLNEYFNAQVGVIHAHRGTVDKFIGDAVMAFWGAPLAQPEQERLAVLCACEMVRTARRMAADWQERGGPALAIGVGLATGDAVVGNVGAEELRAYTAIGDTVNLASRLEGKTKDLGVPVVIDEATATACGMAVRPVGETSVKGRAAVVRVFTPEDLSA